MNLYATLVRMRQTLLLTSTSQDGLLMAALEAASRSIDRDTHRQFYIETATRFFDGQLDRDPDRMVIDDFLSLSAVGVDTDADDVYDDQTWVEDTDYRTWPFNEFPKLELWLHPNGNFGFNSFQKGWSITGEWGYAKSTTPTDASATTGTVATTDGTTLVLSVEDGLEPGQTILVGSERMFVSAVSGTNATVVRKVNGSTAAIHASATVIKVYNYPALVVEACVTNAARLYVEAVKSDIQLERAGDYMYQRASSNVIVEANNRLLSGFVRPQI